MTVWKTSSFCESAACIEVAGHGDLFVLRNTVAPDVTMVASRAEIDAFVKGWLAGEFDEEN